MQLVPKLLQLGWKAATFPAPLLGTRCNADDFMRWAMSHSTVSFDTSRIRITASSARDSPERNFSLSRIRQQY
jgi:hypothetical protein